MFLLNVCLLSIELALSPETAINGKYAEESNSSKKGVEFEMK